MRNENNIMLAKFIGLEIKENNTYYEKGVGTFPLDNLRFDNQWSQLMQVVRQIKLHESCTNFNININGDCIIEGLTNNEIINVIINYEYFNSNLKMIYKACINYINIIK